MKKYTIGPRCRDGYDIRTIQELLGHQELATTMICTHAERRWPWRQEFPASTLNPVDLVLQPRCNPDPIGTLQPQSEAMFPPDGGGHLLKRKTKLSTSMTSTQFENGYWYATEIKNFAERIGIPFASKLRKDELERAIKVFLETGRIENPARRSLSTSGVRDTERGLSLDLRVVVYTNDKATKDFIEREALRIAPGLKRKSGARYRLNRWREDRLADGVPITYRDVVVEYVRLSQTAGPFAQVPIRCYVNFISDFMAAEQNATREQAIEAWKTLKALDVPKDYRSWKRFRSSKAKQ